jgi:hypothetical protein
MSLDREDYALYCLAFHYNRLLELYLLSLQTVYLGLEPLLHQVFEYFSG